MVDTDLFTSVITVNAQYPSEVAVGDSDLPRASQVRNRCRPLLRPQTQLLGYLIAHSHLAISSRTAQPISVVWGSRLQIRSARGWREDVMINTSQYVTLS